MKKGATTVFDYYYTKTVNKPGDKYHGTLYRDVWLYEGIPDENTVYLKEELARGEIADWGYSKEICILTPTRIVRKNKIRIYLHPNKSAMQLGFVLGWREIPDDYNEDESV